MNKIAVVLGGGLNLETQQINLVTQTRFDKVIELESDFDYIISCGDKTYKKEIEFRVQKTEAKAGEEYLLSKGIDSSKIILEEDSRDTFSNAYYVRKKLEELNLGNQLTIITSNFHMSKSKYIFEFVFGVNYNLRFISVDDSMLNQEELEKRKVSESEVIHFYETHLGEIYNVKKADMDSIKFFIENINGATSGKIDTYHEELTKRVQEKIGKCSPIY